MFDELVHLFGYLTLKDLGNVAKVSKLWSEAAKLCIKERTRFYVQKWKKQMKTQLRYGPLVTHPVTAVGMLYEQDFPYKFETANWCKDDKDLAIHVPLNWSASPTTYVMTDSLRQFCTPLHTIFDAIYVTGINIQSIGILCGNVSIWKRFYLKKLDIRCAYLDFFIQNGRKGRFELEITADAMYDVQTRGSSTFRHGDRSELNDDWSRYINGHKVKSLKGRVSIDSS